MQWKWKTTYGRKGDSTIAWIAGAAALGGAVIGGLSSQSAAGKQSEGTTAAIGETQREYDQSRSDLAPYREAGQAALGRLRSLLGISTGVDENDPRYAAIRNGIIANEDAAHRAKYHIGIFDAGSGYHAPGQKSQIEDRWTKMAQQQYLQQYGSQGGDNTDSSPLLRKFSQSDLESDPVYNNGLQFGLDEGTKAIERRASAGGGYDSGATLKALTRFGNDYGSTKAGESYGRFRDVQDATYGKLSGIAGMGSGATNVGVGANSATGSNLASLYTGQGNANAAATIAGGNAITGGINSGLGYYYLNKLSGGGQRTVTPAYSEEG